MRLDAKVLKILAVSSAGILIVALFSILSFAAQSEPIPKFETLAIPTDVGGRSVVGMARLRQEPAGRL